MPWDHCDVKGILDDSKCPGCNISKEQWTLEWDVTRTFTVSAGKTGLKVILHDAAGKPIPSAPYRCVLPDGKTLDGTLDAQGYARIDTGGADTCRLSFPGLDPSHWEAQAAPASGDGGGA